jgi:hypothetical protein
MSVDALGQVLTAAEQHQEATVAFAKDEGGCSFRWQRSASIREPQQLYGSPRGGQGTQTVSHQGGAESGGQTFATPRKLAIAKLVRFICCQNEAFTDGQDLADLRHTLGTVDLAAEAVYSTQF